MPDEASDMFSKRRVMHWDRKKKKFVQVCWRIVRMIV
jgi:hypothetical protein